MARPRPQPRTLLDSLGPHWERLSVPQQGRLVTRLSSGPVDLRGEVVAVRRGDPAAHEPEWARLLFRCDHPKRGKGWEIICLDEEFVPDQPQTFEAQKFRPRLTE